MRNKTEKKHTHTFLTTMYQGSSSTRSLQRNREVREGGTNVRRKKEAQTSETNKGKSFCWKLYSVDVPSKGRSLHWFLLRRSQKVFFFPCAKKIIKTKNHEPVCVYGINVWRRSPAGSQRQTVDDRGERDWCWTRLRPFLADTRIETQLLRRSLRLWLKSRTEAETWRHLQSRLLFVLRCGPSAVLFCSIYFCSLCLLSYAFCLKAFLEHGYFKGDIMQNSLF